MKRRKTAQERAAKTSIETASGRHFDYAAPRAEDVDVRDVARARSPTRGEWRADVQTSLTSPGEPRASTSSGSTCRIA